MRVGIVGLGSVRQQHADLIENTERGVVLARIDVAQTTHEELGNREEYNYLRMWRENTSDGSDFDVESFDVHELFHIPEPYASMYTDEDSTDPDLTYWPSYARNDRPLLFDVEIDPEQRNDRPEDEQSAKARMQRLRTVLSEKDAPERQYDRLDLDPVESV